MKLPNRIGLTAVALGLGLSVPALADWRVDDGVAIVEPARTNGNIELLAISCGDPITVEIYARGGVVQPEAGDVPPDYLGKPGKARAILDGMVTPLVAARSDGAVVLLAEGQAGAGPQTLPRSFATSLAEGKELTLEFDVTADKSKSGSVFETMATFSLTGARAVLDEAFNGCGQ